ncbi:MAG: PD40 domain-containing protein [Bacteroidales bacterium]|nr:PD40 domain-containing protein [Bacteroidales bacterium]
MDKFKLYISALALAFIIMFQTSYSQINVPIDKKEFKTSEKSGYKEALSAIKNGDENFENNSSTSSGGYQKALTEYLAANAYNSNNAALNYKIGVCYIFSTEKKKAISFLEKAYSINPHVSFDIKYVMGMAYQRNGMYKEAISNFTDFKNSDYLNEIKKLKLNEDLFNVNAKIKECEAAEKLKEHPTRVFIDNIGPNINSKYSDYAPVISTDETMMIFTSRREGSIGGRIEDGQYFEDLYISYNEGNNRWSPPTNMKTINTEEHDASVGLSPDGSILYTFNGTPNGNLYESKLKGENWSKPKPLNKNINTKYDETSISISSDGKILYFVSDRPKDEFGTPSVGGKDIFVSERTEKGEWGPARNIGKPINTEFNEEGVFIHPDNRTMYFSSMREGTIGGYDIFYSEMDDDGNWGEPVNIGIPINTPEHDVFFIVTGNGRYAYMSSEREGGLGLQDIWRITFLGPEKPMVAGTEDNLIASSNTLIQTVVKQETVEVKKVRLTIMKGTITDADTGNPLESAIEIVDLEKDEVYATLESNASTGKYLISLPSGKNYGITARTEGYLFHSENVDVPAATSYQEIIKDIKLKTINVGATIILSNIFFDFNKSTLRDISKAELDNLVRLLTVDYPKMVIEIGGHTDNVGSLEYNTKLSTNRAKAVVDYLIAHGVAQERLSYKGYAYQQPIDTNDTEEGRQKNRRVEFKVISVK